MTQIELDLSFGCVNEWNDLISPEIIHIIQLRISYIAV